MTPIRELRRQHAHAIKMARLYPGYGWGKVAARLCRAILEVEAAHTRPEAA